MKKNLYIICICSFIAVGFHLYLSSRSYSLSADKIGKSNICHINNSLNCDNVLASNYSELANIPLSNWGFATHLLIALLSLALLIGWAEKPALLWVSLSSLSLISALASLVMMGISAFVLHVFCPFCIILYLLSFVIFVCTLFSAKFFISIPSLKEARLFLPSVFLVLVLISFISHLIFTNTYNIQSVKKTVKLNMMDWRSSPVKSTEEQALLTTGPPKEKTLITITEFADFLCSYCRNSYYILKILKSTQPQMRIEYFSFPLDECKSKKASCTLTKAVYCAEKQNKGWGMHDLIFDNQKQFVHLTDNQKAISLLKKLSQDLPLKWDQWAECIKSPAALEFTKKQMKAGKDVNITGTPSLFVNGKRVNNRYFTKTLSAIRHHLEKQNPK
ncbi:MAG: thioredoxin domain-containing protein, partial [Oligoflexia bacterium]|nr:thioredoxin domain-containing protein [Bdellovibrionales bacterium]MYE07743.1 thioredoxin domain-containing protein [Oligoflexia bacterium]